MAKIFFKTLRWYISISFLILGIYGMTELAGGDDIRPLALVIVSFAMVFWFSKATYEASKKVFGTGMAILVGCGIVSYFLGAYVVSYYVEISFYRLWALLAGMVGFPVMMRTIARDK
jgi:hypothetical protein